MARLVSTSYDNRIFFWSLVPILPNYSSLVCTVIIVTWDSNYWYLLDRIAERLNRYTTIFISCGISIQREETQGSKYHFKYSAYMYRSDSLSCSRVTSQSMKYTRTIYSTYTHSHMHAYSSNAGRIPWVLLYPGPVVAENPAPNPPFLLPFYVL